MSWRRYVPFLNDEPAEQPDAEPAEQPMREAAGQTIDDDEHEWRRLTGNPKRDLLHVTQTRMREMAYYLWESNPVGNRLIELPLAYMLAEGVSLTVPNEDAQSWLDAFWRDPINRMDLNLPKKVRELALFGEQCWPVFVNDMSGHMRLGTLDPELIETVVHDPDNIAQPIGIVTVKDKSGQARRYRVIVNGPEDVFTARTRQIRETFDTGECFFFKINDLATGQRGRSDLLAVADWLDGYDQYLFGDLERASFMRAFLWDVMLKGATPEEVAKRAREIHVPKPGSVRVHNDAEEWKAVAPQLNQADTAEGARLYRNHVLGGQTIPEHWYGGGGDVNRAAAAEMGEPVFKVMSMRQTFLKYILEEVAMFVIARRLDPTGRSAFDPANPDPDLMPSANFPELTSRDVSKYASALGQVVIAAAAAVDRGLITELLAVRVIQTVAERLGVEFDAEAELKAARKDADEAMRRQQAADAFPDPPDEIDDPADDAEGSANEAA